MKVLCRAIPLVLLTFVLAGPAFAQCGEMDEEMEICTINEEPGCWVEAEVEDGDILYDDPSACFESKCPTRDPCPLLASIGTIQRALVSAVAEDDTPSLVHLIDNPHVTFNANRGAIQIRGCDNVSVIGHWALDDRQVATLLHATAIDR